DPLVNRRGPLSVREMRKQSGAKLPRTNMAQAQDEWLLLPETILGLLEVFQAHAFQDLFHRHAGELHAAEQIRSQGSKMPAHDPAHVYFGKFVAESDAHIAQSQLSIVRQDQ